MKVKFWGVRGSVPSPVSSKEIAHKMVNAIWKSRHLDLDRSEGADFGDDQQKIISDFVSNLDIAEGGTIGGNTPCVQIIPPDGEIIIMDCGSGIRVLGSELMQSDFSRGKGSASIFMSHTHWDHICGLPFFIPLYVPGNKLDFYGGHDDLEARLENQHNPWHFPVPWKALGSAKNFTQMTPDEPVRVGSTEITNHELFHPGKSFGYRFANDDGGIIVYASDAEYKHLQHSKISEYLDFFRDADILIFDTQYTLTEALAKEDWGHSSAMIGIEMAMEAGVKNLVMFHHEPTYSDDKVVSLCVKADQYQDILNDSRHKCKIHIAYEGLVMET